MVCQGKRKTTGGYHWEYYNGYSFAVKGGDANAENKLNT